MSYGILLWGNATDIQSIFVLQKKSNCATYNLGYMQSLRYEFMVSLQLHLNLSMSYIFTQKFDDSQYQY